MRKGLISGDPVFRSESPDFRCNRHKRNLPKDTKFNIICIMRTFIFQLAPECAQI
jgi:hypothetical protein